MIRHTAYLDQETSDAVEAARPGFLSRSSWLALLVSYGLTQQRLINAERPGKASEG